MPSSKEQPQKVAGRDAGQRAADKELAQGRDPGYANRESGEMSVDQDKRAANARVLPDDPMVGAVKARGQGEESGAPIRMVKDGAEMDVDPRDVETHRKMGWGFAR